MSQNARNSRENPIDQAVARFLADQKEQQELGNLSPATVAQRTFALGVLLQWVHTAGATEGVTDINSLDAARLNDYQRWLLKRKRNGKVLSRETARSYVRAARPFLKFAKAPTDGFRSLKSEGYREKEAVTREELKRMEEVCGDERDRLIIRLLGESGLRVQELLDLKPADLREDKPSKSYSVRILGKGNKSEQKKERFAPVMPDVFKRLDTYAKNGPVRGGEYIFYARRSRGGKVQRLTRSGVDQMVRNVAAIAKVSRSDRRIYPHVLRHGAISNMLLGGMNPAVVARFVGHSDLKLIMSTYGHLNIDRTYDQFAKAFAKG